MTVQHIDTQAAFHGKFQWRTPGQQRIDPGGIINRIDPGGIINRKEK